MTVRRRAAVYGCGEAEVIGIGLGAVPLFWPDVDPPFVVDPGLFGVPGPGIPPPGFT